MASRRDDTITAGHAGHEGRATTLSGADGVWSEAEKDNTSLEFRAEGEEGQESEPSHAEFDNLVAR